MNTIIFSGAVLAGGRSSRMGRDKALLKLSDRTFLDIQLEKLRSAGINELMISCAADRLLKRDGAETVIDRIKSKGPLAALQAVLSSSKAPFCMVLSVDSVLVRAETIRTLMVLAEENDAPVVLAASSNGFEPLIGVYKTEILPYIEELIAEDRLAVKNLYKKYPPLFLEVAENDPQLINCNTPEDYEKVKAVAETGI